jgi:hypothetical protein
MGPGYWVNWRARTPVLEQGAITSRTVTLLLGRRSPDHSSGSLLVRFMLKILLLSHLRNRSQSYHSCFWALSTTPERRIAGSA